MAMNIYNKLGFNTEIYRNPLFWKLFWVEFIRNVYNIDNKQPFEQILQITEETH